MAEPSNHFQSLKVGMIGRCVKEESTHIWEGLWYVESLRVLETEPRKEVVTVASTRRLVTGTPGVRPAHNVPLLSETLALVYLRLDLPYERCTDMPAAWFVPLTPPRFWNQPETATEAVVSRSTVASGGR
jgi:hypothetical protein